MAVFNVEFLASNAVPSENVLNATQQLFLNAASEMGFDVADLSLVLVADDDHYAEAVERIDPGGSGFTDNEAGLGVAKTAMMRQTDGTFVNAIVIRLKVLGAALQAFCAESPSELEPIHELSLYLVHHEIGHCVDNVNRPNRISQPIRLPSRGFEISQVTRYYADILESEYAACFFSAPWSTSYNYRDDIKTQQLNLESSRSDAAKLITEYASGSSSITRLASTVAGWCWFHLVLFAKLSASRHGNKALAEDPLIVWPEPDDECIMQLLEEFDAELVNHWKTYPKWTAEPPPFMRETWEAFAQLEGFEFVEDEEGSALYW